MFKASVVSAICHKPGDIIQCKIRFLHQVPIVNSLNAGIQHMFLCISFTSITCCVSLSMILLLACSCLGEILSCVLVSSGQVH